MNLDQVLAEYRRALRELVRPDETAERTPRVTRLSGADGRSSMVYAFDLDASNADGAIHEERARAERLGIELEWKAFSFDSPPDLVPRLRRAGFEVGPCEALVVYDLADGLGAFETTDDPEVRRIVRLEDLDGFRLAAEAAFGKDYASTAERLAAGIREGRRGHDAYVASVDGEPASVGRLYTDPRSAFAGLYGGGTRPEFRSRGLYRAVVAARARDAAAFGARYLTVDALPTSLPILLRLGFVFAADTWPCTFRPGG